MASMVEDESLKGELEEMRRISSIWKKKKHGSSSLVYDHVDDKRNKANKPFAFYSKKDKKFVELWFFSIEQYVAIRGIDDDKDWILFAIIYFIGYTANRWMEFVWDGKTTLVWPLIIGQSFESYLKKSLFLWIPPCKFINNSLEFSK